MMQDPLAPGALASHVWQDFQHLWRKLLVFEVVFQLVQAWLISPLVALLLTFILLRAGHVAVNNQEILEFLLTPWGLLYAALLVVLMAFLKLLEQAGMLVVVAVFTNRSVARLPALKQLQASLVLMWRVGRLGAAKMFWLCLAFSPFVGLAFLTYVVLLTQYDIYFYLSVQPLEFRIAVAIGSVMLVAAAVVGMLLLVNWSLALPILLFESRPPDSVLAASRRYVLGAFWPVARSLLGWLLGMLLVRGTIVALFRLVAALALMYFGRDQLPVLGAFVVLQAILLAVMSFLSTAGLALILNRLYLARSPSQEPEANLEDVSTSEKTLPGGGWMTAALWISGAVVVISPLLMWNAVALKVEQRPTVLVTAHRGLSKQAPENTLIALQKAIDIGADYAEIDVHQTRDGVVVLLHDRDLRRVAGDSRRLDQLDFAEARQLDVGTWFAPEFADQRIPTLEEAISLCRGKIRLNIELKVFGPPEPLAQAVAGIVRQQKFEQECIVTSLSYESLVALRRSDARIPIGIILGQSIGNVNRLDVDALSVRADHLSDTMLQTSHRQGRQVMVWGISGEQQALQQLRRGVDNLITSDPAPMLQLRDRWQESSDRDRLVIASRLLLGMNPQ